MPFLHTNFAALEQAAYDISSTMTRLDNGLEELAGTLRPMVDTWDGDAQQAFKERQKKWTQAADAIQRILLDWKDKTKAAQERAAATETQNASSY